MSTFVSSPALVRFGVFEADLRSGELRKSGAKVKIQELPFQVLRVLLRHPNEVVDRDQLRQALWPDGVYVDFDRGVISAINRLRDALGDSAENPVFIETVGRRGYRWIAPALSLGQLPQVDAKRAPVPDPIPEIARPLPSRSPLWIWFLFVPALAILVAGGIYRLNHRAARASAASALSSRTSSSHPVNQEAQDFYLKGRFYWNQRTPESLNKAVDFFTQAIVHDPDYAPAYVGLADCYNLLREYSILPASEAYSRALAAAKKATELDDRSSEAHASLAFAAFNGMWDVATSDREFRRAIELDPQNGIAHHWYATSLAALGRYPQSITEIDRAQALDPASQSILADKARIFWQAGRREEALSLLRQLEAAEPRFISPHRYLRFAYLENADYPNYLKEFKQEAQLTGDASELAVAEAAANGFAAGQAKGLFNGILVEQKKLYKAGKFPAYLIAQTCARLGDQRSAMEYLNNAYAERDDNIPDLETDPAFLSIHSEPGFRQLLAKVGLPPLT